MMKQIESEAAYQTLVEQSATTPVFLFKHSTRCGISANARRQVEQFLAASPDVPCWEVLVIEQRPLSQAIAAASGVVHTSPQIILFHHGAAVWNTSHFDITAKAMQAALEKVGADAE
ncbi:MAG TPA: bacillithiol system redox-active protein YtxJ [Armatimonadota bacterium]|jgi:bacillithiol system protein YtxJ